ncbi:MAG: NifB/NifX family molybdenum-iron cluster-binding protein [Bacteroidales bacterium]|nr:NifB/NifX family molybdenum-iron cluster-binding protein [Bacteroidales bacterium]
MKILFTAKGTDWNANPDNRFGRGKYFVVYDEEQDHLTAHSNEENMNAGHGAGIQAAQKAINLGVDVIISAELGPKARQTIGQSHCKLYTIDDSSTIQELYEQYKKGHLKEQ